jgi:hypothetical protein
MLSYQVTNPQSTHDMLYARTHMIMLWLLTKGLMVKHVLICRALALVQHTYHWLSHAHVGSGVTSTVRHYIRDPLSIELASWTVQGPPQRATFGHTLTCSRLNRPPEQFGAFSRGHFWVFRAPREGSRRAIFLSRGARQDVDPSSPFPRR